jgi:RNA-directed DNA polymerase
MQTYSTVSKRMNEGITMNVSDSTTPNNEADAISGHAELDGEKLTDMSNWNLINWNSVKLHVNRIQVRITKAVI